MSDRAGGADSRIGILTGPTAAGKTGLAIELALRAGDIEIVNADSMLVYRGMSIGTAKPGPDELARVPHHLIDIRDPDVSYTAGDFVLETQAALSEIQSRGKRPLIVGGTGFYLKALLYGLWEAPKADAALRADIEKRTTCALYDELFARDEESALRIGGNDRYRLVRAHELMILSGKTPSELQASRPTQPDPRFALWVLDRENDELYRRISLRTAEMLKSGFLDEVKQIRAAYPGSRALTAIGYAQACDFIDGVKPAGRRVAPGLQGLQDEIELATRQLVKRQRTWFRGQAIAEWFTLARDLAKFESRFFEVYPERKP